MKRIILIFMLIIGINVYSQGGRNLSHIIFEENVEFNKIELADALALISKLTSVNIIAESKISKEQLNIFIGKGQSLRTILDIVKNTNNLSETHIGDAIMLTSSQKGNITLIGKVIDKKNQGIEGVKITLKDSDFPSVTTNVGGLFICKELKAGVYIVSMEKEGYFLTSDIIEIKDGENQNVTFSLEKENKTNSINGRSNNNNNNIIERKFGSLNDKAGKEVVTERIQLKHGFSKDIKDVLDSILEDSITVTSFPKLHMLVIKGERNSLEIAKKLINDLDREVKQVRITAQVLDTTDNLFEDLGFNWLFTSKNSQLNNYEEGGSISLLPWESNGAIGSSVINFVNLYNSGQHLLSFSIDMLEGTEDLSISSVPSIVIVNGEEAEFRVTEEVIVGERESSDDDNNRVKEPIFEEAGTIFKVTPTIRDGKGDLDTIILDISSEVSDFKLSQGGTYNESGGSKIQNNIATKIQIKDGDVIFIGGLKKIVNKDSTSKVPLLGDIPVFGTLFKNNSASSNVRQVYIQITAEIIDNTNMNENIKLEKFKK